MMLRFTRENNREPPGNHQSIKDNLLRQAPSPRTRFAAEKSFKYSHRAMPEQSRRSFH